MTFRIGQSIGTLHADRRGSASMQWTLLLAGIALPMGVMLVSLLNLLATYYGMMTTLNALPFP